MRKRREIEMSVVDARDVGEGAHILARFGDLPSCNSLPIILDALAVLWQQERGLRIEVAKLQERLGIRPDKRIPENEVKKYNGEDIAKSFRDGYDSGLLAGVIEGTMKEQHRILNALGVMEVIEDALHAHTHSYHDEDE